MARIVFADILFKSIWTKVCFSGIISIDSSDAVALCANAF
jgi:hypothetical protein